MRGEYGGGKPEIQPCGESNEKITAEEEGSARTRGTERILISESLSLPMRKRGEFWKSVPERVKDSWKKCQNPSVWYLGE